RTAEDLPAEWLLAWLSDCRERRARLAHDRPSRRFPPGLARPALATPPLLELRHAAAAVLPGVARPVQQVQLPALDDRGLQQRRPSLWPEIPRKDCRLHRALQPRRPRRSRHAEGRLRHNHPPGAGFSERPRSGTLRHPQLLLRVPRDGLLRTDP